MRRRSKILLKGTCMTAFSFLLTMNSFCLTPMQNGMYLNNRSSTQTQSSDNTESGLYGSGTATLRAGSDGFGDEELGVAPVSDGIAITVFLMIAYTMICMNKRRLLKQ